MPADVALLSRCYNALRLLQVITQIIYHLKFSAMYIQLSPSMHDALERSDITFIMQERGLVTISVSEL